MLAVLKHRLFSAQLNSYKMDNDIRRSLVFPLKSTRLCRPGPALLWKDAVKGGDGLVRAFVQVLEKRVANPFIPVASPKKDKPPRPPLPLAPALLTANNADSNDSPASKDEGYSTMSSNVQVDSSSSSSSSFIASSCSSLATLRRSGSGGSTVVPSTTRSLPMAKRKTLLSLSPAESRPQPKLVHFPARDAFRRRTGRTRRRGVGRGHHEETPSSAHFLDHVASSSFNPQQKESVFFLSLC